jgi:hypothetical protein
MTKTSSVILFVRKCNSKAKLLSYTVHLIKINKQTLEDTNMQYEYTITLGLEDITRQVGSL